MKKIVRGLLNNRKTTLVFVVVLIAAGIFSFIESPKQESPDFSIPYAMITTVFPGASQNDVDAYVTEPIEKAIHSVQGYESSSAYSSNSLSLVIVEMEFSADRDASFRELKESMASLQKSLPEECGDISVNTNITDTAGVLIRLSSDKLTNGEILSQAEFIKDKLSEIDGFDRFEIIGSLDLVLSVQINETAMQSAGLSYSDVYSIIEAGNLDIPIGKVKEESSSIIVNYSGGYDSIDDIKNLEIGYSPQLQKIIRMQDIAKISYEETASNTYYKHNGDDAVILAGYFDDEINILPLKNEINDKLESLELDLPDELKVSLILSQPDEIDNSLVDFSKNLIMAVVLVIFVVLIGMGLRNALVVSVSLPLSVLISFGVMYLAGIKIHQVSIASLILCLGMLVDNSIVVSDSIQGFLDSGIEKKKACIMGVKNVSAPVFASTITTIAAFLPFMFLNSIAGDYIKSLPQIVSISLAASYFTAMLVIPVLGYILFKPSQKKNKKKGIKYFKQLLKKSLENKILIIVIVLVLIAASVFVAFQLDTIFFPASDINIIYIDVRNNESDNIESTVEIVDGICQVIDKEAGVIEYSSSSGGGLPRFNQIMYIYTKTPDIGQIMMRVDIEKAGFDTNEQYKLNLQEKIDNMNLNAKVVVKELMYAFPMDEDLKIRITGDNIDDLKKYEDDILSLMEKTSGLINIKRSNTSYIEEYSLEISSEKAIMYGLLPAEIQNELSIALLGRQASTVRHDGSEVNIMVSGGYSTSDELMSAPIKTAQGQYVSAGEIITLKKTEVLSTLPRYNGDYALTVTADYDLDYNKNEILSELKDSIDELNMENANVIYEGEDALIKENFGQVGILGVVALAIVFLILMVQFKSLSMPLLIFITIPLSAVGSIVGLFITSQPISFTALLGVVSLLGIVVNNAIILIDYFNKEKAEGLSTDKACIGASIKRLRPILLSTITTVIGLIPLAISNSDLFKPMAIALMSGLLVSTMLTLIVIPVLLSIVKKDKV